MLLHPQLPIVMPGHILYDYILRGLDTVLNHVAFGYAMLTVTLLFCQALYINAIAAKHKLFGKITYIPAFTFLLLTSLYPPFNYFSEALLINWCVLGAIDIVLSFNQTTSPRKQIFNAGFLFALAALLQFSALGYFLLFLVSMIVLRAFQPSEWVVGLLGYCTPFYFFICLLFLVDKLSLFKKWPHLVSLIPGPIKTPVYFIGLVSGILILFLGGVFGMQIHVPKSSIYIRRNWLALTFYLIISIGVAICSDILAKDAWLMVIPALTFLISHAFSIEKRKRFSNFIFYFSLLFLIFCQLTYK